MGIALRGFDHSFVSLYPQTPALGRRRRGGGGALFVAEKQTPSLHKSVSPNPFRKPVHQIRRRHFWHVSFGLDVHSTLYRWGCGGGGSLGGGWQDGWMGVVSLFDA